MTEFNVDINSAGDGWIQVTISGETVNTLTEAQIASSLSTLPIAVEGKEGWRPIASAPQDGKIVMLAWSPDDWTTGQGFYRDGKWVAVGTFYNHAAGNPPYEFRQITVAPVLWKDIGSPSSDVSK